MKKLKFREGKGNRPNLTVGRLNRNPAYKS